MPGGSGLRSADAVRGLESVPARCYSSASSRPRVGLCFSGLVVLAGTGRDGLGLPTLSRAISRTTLAALKVFFFRLWRLAGIGL